MAGQHGKLVDSIGDTMRYIYSHDVIFIAGVNTFIMIWNFVVSAYPIHDVMHGKTDLHIAVLVLSLWHLRLYLSSIYCSCGPMSLELLYGSPTSTKRTKKRLRNNNACNNITKCLSAILQCHPCILL